MNSFRLSLLFFALIFPQTLFAQWEDGVAAIREEWNWLGVLDNGAPASARSINAHPLVGVVDRNRDGYVTLGELTGMLEPGRQHGQAAGGLQPLSALLEARFAKADGNGDGGIELQELMQIRRAYLTARGKDPQANPNRLRKQAKRVLGRMDTSGDGKISRAEFAAATAAFYMRQLDSDRNKKISPSEWQRTLQ